MQISPSHFSNPIQIKTTRFDCILSLYQFIYRNLLSNTCIKLFFILPVSINLKNFSNATTKGQNLNLTEG